MAEAKQNLDGKTPIKPVPFDAHEQLVRGTHVPTNPADKDSGPKNPRQYPKAVDHVAHPSGVGHEPVLVNSAKEEKDYLEAKLDDDVD